MIHHTASIYFYLALSISTALILFPKSSEARGLGQGDVRVVVQCDQAQQ